MRLPVCCIVFSFLLVSSLVVGCRTSVPADPFYRPVGTLGETYKRYPEELEISIYPHDQPTSDGAVLFIHGGGWRIGGADVPLYADWEPRLRSANLRGFAIEHRVAPRYRGRDLVEDCLDGIEYVLANAGRFGMQPRIALVGFSSGGHLAVLAAQARTRPRVGVASRGRDPLRAVVAYYAPLDTNHLIEHGNDEVKAMLHDYLPEFESAVDRQEHLRTAYFRQMLRDVSPLERLHMNSPDILLVHGQKDALIPFEQSVRFTERANALRPGMARLIALPNATHNFNVSRSRWARRVEDRAIEFILERFSEAD